MGITTVNFLATGDDDEHSKDPDRITPILPQRSEHIQLVA